MTGYHHEPVLLREVVDALRPRDAGLYVDCTLGGGGHAGALLSAAACRVIGLDRDPAALEAAGRTLAAFGDRLTRVHGAFSDLEAILDRLGVRSVDGVLADIGVSSHQLDTPERGFAFRTSGPLDMRMDPTSDLTAETLVNESSEAELADLIFTLGEERLSRRVARAIVSGRPFNDTTALALAIAKVVPKSGRIHPATRTFQALRMRVNDELGELDALLPAAVRRLSPGGRLAVITFHSLEDRRVKTFLADQAGRGRPRDPWGNPIGPVHVTVLPDRASAPDDPNPRARSARLRVAERLPWNEQ